MRLTRAAAAQAIVFNRPGAPDDIGVSMSTYDSQVESLTSLLQTRAFSITDEQGSQALSLLAEKYDNPTPAVMAAYVLLRSNPKAMPIDWLINLAADFNYADSYLPSAILPNPQK